MKTTLFILSILLLTSVTSCHSNDDSNSDYGLEGEWNLTHVSGGLVGVDKSFEPGLIVWTFNESTGNMIVVNNSEDGFSMFQSGTYSFSIQDEGDYNSITIDGMAFGSIEIFQNQVKIDQMVADGFLLELTK
jgi:hypothetical protein